MEHEEPGAPEPKIPELAREYATWCATPVDLREPIYKRDWARQNDITPRMLSNWELAEWWPALLAQHSDGKYGLSMRHDMAVIDALHAKALGGDTNAIKLWMEYRGMVAKKERSTAGNGDQGLDLQGMSTDKLMKLLEATQSVDNEPLT